VRDKLLEMLAGEGISFTENQLETLLRFNDMVLENNKKFNLTAITDEDGIVNKHFADSLKGLKYLQNCDSVADIGSGAGFPAVPLKVFLPDTKFLLIDSLKKRVEFLASSVSALGLKNISCVHSRIEDAGRGEYRGKFSCVTARAVAELSVLVEYAVPLLKKGGMLLAYKGNVAEELENAKNAMKILNCEVEKVDEFSIMGAARSLVIIRKTGETPDKYPRQGNKPRINPL